MERLITSVAARFGFDCEHWTADRLRRWYDRHAKLYAEEQETIEKLRKEAGLGRS